MSKKRDEPRFDSTTFPEVRVVPAAHVRGPLDDDRPTELHQRVPQQELAHTREQLISGSTVREIMNNQEHNLSDALGKLLESARRKLPNAEVDARASLVLRHHFEFDRRVGYDLKLKLFDAAGVCVEVVAELDQDGRAIRRGSVFMKLINI
jgi:hypothetical protein